jgi:NDP-sugar pyrophosphorylase family protein
LYDENNKIHYSTVFGACSFFNDFGTKEDLARLENLTPSPEWRHSLVKETIKALKGRLEKNGLGK